MGGGSSTAKPRVCCTRGGGWGGGKGEICEPLFKETKLADFTRAPLLCLFARPAPFLPVFLPAPPTRLDLHTHVLICTQDHYPRPSTICIAWPCPGWRMLIACSSCPAHQRKSIEHMQVQVDLLTKPENILAVRQHLPRDDVRNTTPRPYRAPAKTCGGALRACWRASCAPATHHSPTRTPGTARRRGGNQLSTPSNSVSRNRKNS